MIRPPIGPTPFAYLGLALSLLAAAGCVDVVDSSPTAVWVQKPLLSFGTIEGTAEAECAKYGKRAVPSGTLQHRYDRAGGSGAQAAGQKSVFVPIYAFACE